MRVVNGCPWAFVPVELNENGAGTFEPLGIPEEAGPTCPDADPPCELGVPAEVEGTNMDAEAGVESDVEKGVVFTVCPSEITEVPTTGTRTGIKEVPADACIPLGLPDATTMIEVLNPVMVEGFPGASM
jgi:hypothetical protein